jgi:beta-fructofuranosidase
MNQTVSSPKLCQMGYTPRNKFLWDCWFIKHNGRCHAFYLQANRTRDAEKRHNNRVSIGHAVSSDLCRWKELPTALLPGRQGAWDDLALWTGSVFRHRARFYLFYTGRCREKNRMWIQKIGLAFSDDLIHWEKSPHNPVLEYDPAWYQMHNGKNALGKIAAWRDPFVFRDPVSKRFCMTISAKEAGRSREYNGCIALAESADLLHWTVHPPLLAPGRYDEMECSQMVHYGGLCYLFFSTWKSGYEPGWAKRVSPVSGLHCYCAKTLRGRYRPVNRDAIVLDYGSRLYSAMIAARRGRRLRALGWLNQDEKGRFVGRLGAPFTLNLEGDRVSLVGDYCG